MKNDDSLIEHERKFLILSPVPLDKGNFPSCKIKQRYIKQDKNPIQRIRNTDNISYKLTQKHVESELVGKIELEKDLSLDEFNSLKKYIIPNIYWPICKQRYEIPHDNYLIQLDYFDEAMDNLIIAEVEFSSLDHALSFVPPSWFGPELTGHISNKKLYLQWPSIVSQFLKNPRRKHPKKQPWVLKKSLKHIDKTQKELHVLKYTLGD